MERREAHRAEAGGGVREAEGVVRDVGRRALHREGERDLRVEQEALRGGAERRGVEPAVRQLGEDDVRRVAEGGGERHAAAVAARVVREQLGARRRLPPWKHTSSSGAMPRSRSAAAVTILKMLARGRDRRERDPAPGGSAFECSASASTRPVPTLEEHGAPHGTRYVARIARGAPGAAE